MTFTQVLDQTRDEMAKSLLAGPRRRLSAIADLLGFSSLSAFSHWFKARFGQNATAYRAARRPIA